MRTGFGWLCALALLAAAGCAREPEEDQVTSDTMSVRGADTVGGQLVPTIDTVIRTTTTEVEVDTIRGKPADTMRKDTSDR